LRMTRPPARREAGCSRCRPGCLWAFHRPIGGIADFPDGFALFCRSIALPPLRIWQTCILFLRGHFTEFIRKRCAGIEAQSMMQMTESLQRLFG